VPDMPVLSSSSVLDLWDRGSQLHSLDQGLLALSVGFPETPYQTLADWPLGRRNRALAELRWSWFGPHLEGWASCPKCGEKLEFQLDARSFATLDAPGPEPVMVDGRCFRLPTTRDLARAAGEADPQSAALRLLEGCRLEEGEALSDDDLEAVGEKMAAADPLAETRLSLVCPNCGNQWEDTVDIAAFLWADIDARARRLLREVHTLGSAYGWTEREILSLSDRRRAVYLEMAQA
jgi:predicted RNA-binding Zn-ribbon protein involved in translation (DUF1610 family)